MGFEQIFANGLRMQMLNLNETEIEDWKWELTVHEYPKCKMVFWNFGDVPYLQLTM